MDIEQLATLAATPRRTIRFYVQEGLLPPPDGERRGASYSEAHLERLLAIRRLQQDGLSLEAIRRRLAGGAESDFVPPRPGSVEVWSRIHIRDGVEIHVEPGRARLNAEQIRQLAARVRDWMEQTANGEEQ